VPEWGIPQVDPLTQKTWENMLNSIQINTDAIDALGLSKQQRDHLLKHIEEVLIALRRVIRATDLHSLRDKGQVTIGELAQEMSLSQATVTTILDRLEKRGLVYRQRSLSDKRKVHAYLTETATETLKSAPIPLQDRFTREFSKLDEWEQAMIMSALKRVAQMMDAQHIDASPVLDIGLLDRFEDEQEADDKPTKSR